MNNKLRSLPIIEALAKKKNIKNHVIFDIRDLYLKYMGYDQLSANSVLLIIKLIKLYKSYKTPDNIEALNNLEQFVEKHVKSFSNSFSLIDTAKCNNDIKMLKENITDIAAILSSAYKDIADRKSKIISTHDEMLFEKIKADLEDNNATLPYDKIIYLIEDNVCLVTYSKIDIQKSSLYQLDANNKLILISKDTNIVSRLEYYNINSSIIDITMILSVYKDIITYNVNNDATSELINILKSKFSGPKLTDVNIYDDLYISYLSISEYLKNVISVITVSNKILSAKNFIPEKDVIILNTPNKKKTHKRNTTIKLMYSNIDISMEPRTTHIYESTDDMLSNNNIDKNDVCHHKVTHRRRGHFKYYSKERPLFGRYSGLIWVDDTIINKNKGELKDTEYTVKL